MNAKNVYLQPYKKLICHGTSEQHVDIYRKLTLIVSKGFIEQFYTFL